MGGTTPLTSKENNLNPQTSRQARGAARAAFPFGATRSALPGAPFRRHAPTVGRRRRQPLDAHDLPRRPESARRGHGSLARAEPGCLQMEQWVNLETLFVR